MKTIKVSLYTLSMVVGGFLSANAFSQTIDQATAVDLALSLATSGAEQGGLGCNKAAVAKTDTVDVYRDGAPHSLFRVVLYADCIPCLQVYMFDKESGKKVFSRSVILQDAYSYNQTCVIDRDRYLPN